MSSFGIKGRRSVKLDGIKKECTKGVHSFLFGITVRGKACGGCRRARETLWRLPALYQLGSGPAVGKLSLPSAPVRSSAPVRRRKASGGGRFA